MSDQCPVGAATAMTERPGSGKTGKRRLPKFAQSLLQAKLALFGLFVLSSFAFMAIAAPILAPHDPQLIILKNRLRPPVWTEEGIPGHLLGTDSLGRDILSRVMYGARISMLVALSAVGISGTVGVVLGTIAGYYRGAADDVLMRFADIQLAFPSIVLYIAVMALVGSGLKNIILVLGFSGWVTYGRVVRGQVMSCREQEFVLAARAVGVRDVRIMARHIFPNTVAPLLIIATTAIAGVIISEASLSFLGLGVPPDVASWGSMLAEGREYIRSAWWLAMFPGLAIMLTVLGINTFGDWLRDYLDPRLKSR